MENAKKNLVFHFGGGRLLKNEKKKNIFPAPLVIETAWLGLADLILGMTLLLKKSSSLILQCVIAVASEVTLPRQSASFSKHSCEERGLTTKIIIILSRDLPKGEVIG